MLRAGEVVHSCLYPPQPGCRMVLPLPASTASRRDADPDLRGRVETELARATTTLIVLHVRHALRFADATTGSLPMHAAVAIYLDEVGVASELRAAVYALAVARAAHPLVALPAARAADGVSGRMQRSQSIMEGGSMPEPESADAEGVRS
jgi:hypothetical protein